MSDDPASRLSRLRAEGGFFAVAEVARFAIRGADRLRYLNGQVSNDLRKLAPGRAMAACILSAKGRLDGVVWIWAEADRFVVEGDAAFAEHLAMRLERYIVADDVEVAVIPPTPTFHVFGPAAAAFPDARQISRLNFPGVDLESPPTVCPEASPDEIERLRIEHAVPRWGAELSPETLPAEAGLDATAVDFHKGCYIGQEVVSRIKSVGHANRALRVFDLIAGDPPVAGAELFLPGETGRPAAVVTSIHFALSPAVGLCYIKRGTSEEAMLTTAAAGSEIKLRPPATLNA